jgi:transposase
MNVTTVGVDLAKNVFSVHGVGRDGKVVLRRCVGRADLLAMFAQIPPCLIGMEACSGAHHFARELRRLGHDARIMAPRFVAPYRKSGKNDGNDAEAICEAVARPNMRFVAVKSVEQQALLMLHRVRKEVSDQRTALINQLRGMLCEFGVVLPRGRYSFRHKLPPTLEDTGNAIPELARRLFREVNERIRALDEQILAYDRELEALARHSEAAQRLMEMPGVGPITATAIIASVADMKVFKSGREFAAWLGLVPRQYSTGGKVRLGRITKQGDVYLRTLLIHGTRAVLAALGTKDDRLSLWIRSLIERRGYRKATVALAAKHARMIWAILAKGHAYRRPTAV